MQSHVFSKEYIAVCNGIFDKKEGIINFPIGRCDDSIIKRKIIESGESAITKYSILRDNISQNLSIVKITLLTGRTHQIRVHMSYINHSILGDDLYGNSSTLISRQALHAYKINFLHPITNKKIEIISRIPDDMNKIINSI